MRETTYYAEMSKDLLILYPLKSLERILYRYLSARIPHPTSLRSATFSPGEGIAPHGGAVGPGGRHIISKINPNL